MLGSIMLGKELSHGRRPTWCRVKQQSLPFLAPSTASPPKTGAFACGAAAKRERTFMISRVRSWSDATVGPRSWHCGTAPGAAGAAREHLRQRRAVGARDQRVGRAVHDQRRHLVRQQRTPRAHACRALSIDHWVTVGGLPFRLLCPPELKVRTPAQCKTTGVVC